MKRSLQFVCFHALFLCSRCRYLRIRDTFHGYKFKLIRCCRGNEKHNCKIRFLSSCAAQLRLEVLKTKLMLHPRKEKSREEATPKRELRETSTSSTLLAIPKLVLRILKNGIKKIFRIKLIQTSFSLINVVNNCFFSSTSFSRFRKTYVVCPFSRARLRHVPLTP